MVTSGICIWDIISAKSTSFLKDAIKPVGYVKEFSPPFCSPVPELVEGKKKSTHPFGFVLA